MKHNGLKTQSGNYLIAYKNNYFYINLSSNKILKQMSEEDEYQWLSGIVDYTEIEIPETLISLLDKASSFLEDAASLLYFKNQALMKVYPFIKETYEVEVRDLKENRNVLLCVPNYYSYDCVQGCIYSDTDVMFFNKEKELIGKVKNSIDRRYASNHDTNYMEDGESIIEAIASQELEERVAYILIESKSNGDYNNSQRIRTQVVYLVDNDLVKLIQDIKKEAENEVVSN